jgi:hypothetical protein
MPSPAAKASPGERKDVHQRGFSRAVFSHQGQYFSLPDGERNVAAGEDPGEALGDVLYPEAGNFAGVRFHGRPPGVGG